MQLLVIGCGGHARTVLDTAKVLGHSILGLIDVDFSGQDETILGVRVLGGMEVLTKVSQSEVKLFVAIGDNQQRQKLTQELVGNGFEIATLIHPTAIISESAMVEAGAIVCAGAIINPVAKIGAGSIVNTGSIVDHESQIGEFVHVSPGSSIAGRVSVGTQTFVGIGTSVIDQISIGKNVVIGAGSVVIKDIDDNAKVVGVSKSISS
ncbi:MAG: acetyltransferase [Flavobacteriales bacterium]